MPRRRDVAFDRVADEYDETRGGRARATVAAVDVAEHLVPGRVLEVGVGTGIVAEALSSRAGPGAELAGVDISAPMLARAGRRLPGRVLRASALRLPFGAGQFDTVVVVHVLHLVSDVGAAVAEAARVLRGGGRLVAVHGPVEHEHDDELVEATRGLRLLAGPPPDPPEVVRAAAAAAGLHCLLQRPTSAQVAEHSPASLADLVERRMWTMLWDIDDAQWRREVVPVLEALRALPDPDRPRRQEGRRTLSVFERP